MSCFNEEDYIESAVESLVDDYFLENCELIVVDGMSTDGTLDIIKAMMEKDTHIRLFENRERDQAHGLNIGIRNARKEIIVRADAHCLYPRDYIKSCVELLITTGSANAGGMMLAEGRGAVQQAIAWAMRHPVGVGDARFHLGDYQGSVDTVYLGTFRKILFEEIGLYDTNFKTNEDAELNLRILEAGKKIYLDSSIQVVYFPRESIKELAVQYFQYGKGRCQTTLKHKKFTSWRQAAPVALVAFLAVCLGLSFLRISFLAGPALYVLFLLAAAFLPWKKRPLPLKQKGLAGAAFATMHIAWGVGFLSYLANFRRCDR